MEEGEEVNKRVKQYGTWRLTLGSVFAPPCLWELFREPGFLLSSSMHIAKWILGSKTVHWKSP